MRWPQIAVAVLFIVVYAMVTWIKARDLSMPTTRALVEIAATGVLLLVLTVALREGGFW